MDNTKRRKTAAVLFYVAGALLVVIAGMSAIEGKLSECASYLVWAGVFGYLPSLWMAQSNAQVTTRAQSDPTNRKALLVIFMLIAALSIVVAIGEVVFLRDFSGSAIPAGAALSSLAVARMYQGKRNKAPSDS
jgi:predicted nucleic acid-binding Zn ribbon protein